MAIVGMESPSMKGRVGALGEPVQAGICSGLPVELVRFSAQAKGRTASLNRETASEENNAGFEVQRSTDGRNFHTMGFVEGQGTTAEVQPYSYEDANLSTNRMYYYRLKPVDNNGAFEYSEVVTARIENAGAKAGDFYPNSTVAGRTQLDYTAAADTDLSIEVYDLTGKLLQSETESVREGTNNLSFGWSGLPKGTVFVRLSENGDDVVYKKLVVE